MNLRVIDKAGIPRNNNYRQIYDTIMNMDSKKSLEISLENEEIKYVVAALRRYISAHYLKFKVSQRKNTVYVTPM